MLRSRSTASRVTDLLGLVLSTILVYLLYNDMSPKEDALDVDRLWSWMSLPACPGMTLPSSRGGKSIILVVGHSQSTVGILR